ncbi:MAG: 2-hydroxy-6-oxononadienedioate/2-hydroxy-6-oxononatrienedioate hydrolase [Pseudomonadota bacterium]|jgi:pimeloyl-ACP methyl ester carboxylesterase
MKKGVTVLLLAALSLLSMWLWTPDLPRAELEARYLAAPDDMRSVGPWRLHVRDSGPRDAPAVVLLHGFGSSLQTWDDWAEGLSKTHRVIRLDLPGSGLSPPDPAHDYSDARSLQMLLALLDELGVQRASLVGHSMGGRIAWTLAARHPERTERLVLVAPDGFASFGIEYGKAMDVPASWGLMRHALPRAVLRMNLQAAYARPESLTEARVTRYHELLRAPGARRAMLDRLRQTVLQAPVPLLRQIRAPTLLVWGEADAMIPFVHAQDYLQAIAGSRLAAFAGTGHLPQEEAAQASLQAVAAFLP